MNSKLFKRTIIIQSIIFGALAIFATAIYFLAGWNNDYNTTTWFYKWYWAFIGPFLFLFLLYSLWGIRKAYLNQECIPVKIADKSIKYGFLLKKLVARDFKSKYKRSILGIFWSFLNPLLMMGTQYLIFSTLFGNDTIVNYPVYLLIGVIFFSFVSESSNTGMVSISSNANLINKVYVPKYIYPLSKVISAAINFLFSVIPLIVFMLVTKVWPSPVHPLFLLDIFLLFIFALGLAMFLSTILVFFRDIQFLWGIIIMVWMYATPIFYSPENFGNKYISMVIKFNPLYHYIKFARDIFGSTHPLTDAGNIVCMCPNLSTIGICIGCSILMFVIGAFVFKKNQDKFILYL